MLGREAILIVVAASSFVFAAPISAEARPDTRTLSCAQAKALVDREGAITLSTGDVTYQRFVAGSSQCRPLGVARTAYAPTRDDRNCRLQTCRRPRSSDGSR